MWDDLRFGARHLFKEKRTLLLGLAALAMAIGASNTIFVIVNAVLLRELPVHQPDRLVSIETRNARNRSGGASYLDYVDWQTGRAFEGLAASTDAATILGDAQHPPERLLGTYISAHAFNLLGVQPVVGRTFVPREDAPQEPPVAILSHRLWRNRYGADPSVIGRVARVNGIMTTIVGVMPESFRFPMDTDLWQPLGLFPGIAENRRDARSLSIVGRLAQGVDIAQARAELEGIAASLRQQHPETNKDIEPRLVLLTERYVPREVTMLMTALIAAVIFVLLIACANVANLLLAQASARSHEIAARIALGATRGRIVRQLLVENVLMSALAGLAGLGLSIVGIRLFSAAIASTNPPFWLQLTFDFRVFAFLVAVSLVTGAIAGVAPALGASRTDVNEILKEASMRGSSSARSRRWTLTFVTMELAFTLILLGGAGLMVRSFLELYRTDFGIDTGDLTIGRLALPAAKYAAPERRAAFYQQLEDRLHTVAGFTGASIASAPPGGGGKTQIVTSGRREDRSAASVNATIVPIGDDYFRTLNVPLLQGRTFGKEDGAPGRAHAVVNEQFAATFFPSQNSIGQRIEWFDSQDQATPAAAYTIVGVVKSVRQDMFEVTPVVYVPYRAQPMSAATVLVKGTGNARSIGAQIAAELQRLDPDLALFDVQPLDQFLAFFRWPQRVFGGVFVVLACIGLCLSVVGLYGIANYSVTQRTREIGIRMALGAREPQVLWLIVRQIVTALIVGVLIGLAGAAALSKLIPAFLVQASSADFPLLIVLALLLMTVAILACVGPIRRAATMDPVTALRNG
jgi:predicted permease